jgi:hypothetical protein
MRNQQSQKPVQNSALNDLEWQCRGKNCPASGVAATLGNIELLILNRDSR